MHPREGTRVFVLLAILVAIGLASVAVVGIVFAGPSADGSVEQPRDDPTELAAATAVPGVAVEEFDRTVFRIEVFADGSARWTTEYSRELDDEDEIEQFDTFAAEFEDDPGELYDNFQSRAAALVDGGTNATGRTMDASDFDHEAFVDPRGQERGIVRMSFVWGNFAEVVDDGLQVADVFSGGWAIDTNQRLEILAGDDVVMTAVDPDPDSGSIEEGSLTWFGESQFADRRPSVQFLDVEDADDADEVGVVDDQTDTDVADDTDEPVDNDNNDDAPADTAIGMSTVLVLLLLIVAIGVGLAWYSGVIGRAPSEEGDTVAETAGGGETTTPEAGETSEPAVPIEETMSDEDRVLALLENNGGRMKQVSIVDQTNWSKSKVSMLLSDMEEEGLISKLRVGRENIISLEGQEPEAAGSPFDDG